MRIRLGIIAVGLFVVGIGVGYAAKPVDLLSYRAQPKGDAAKALLRQALVQAGDGSWERIAVGRVYYLGGMKSEGQAIFDQVLAKPDPSDLFRIARVYREAGEWSKAKPLFDKALQENPEDEKGLAEVGAYYLASGDRVAAEALFERSFKVGAELWATVSAAAAYMGVEPQE